MGHQEDPSKTQAIQVNERYKTTKFSAKELAEFQRSAGLNPKAPAPVERERRKNPRKAKGSTPR